MNLEKPYRIRKACLEDYAGWAAAMEEVDLMHVQRLPEQFTTPTGPTRSMDFFAGLLNDPNCLVLITEQDGEITGTLIAWMRDTPPIPMLVPRRYGVIDTLVVRRAYQGSGAGRALMEQAEDWAAGMGAVDIELTVYLFNQSAVQFYEHLGYQGVYQKMARHITRQSG